MFSFSCSPRSDSIVDVEHSMLDVHLLTPSLHHSIAGNIAGDFNRQIEKVAFRLELKMEKSVLKKWFGTASLMVKSRSSIMNPGPISGSARRGRL